MKIEDIDKLEAMEKAATPGPWEWTGTRRKDPMAVGDLYAASGPVLWDAEDYGGCLVNNQADARLIVEMRNALPGIIAELRAKRA